MDTPGILTDESEVMARKDYFEGILYNVTKELNILYPPEDINRILFLIAGDDLVDKMRDYSRESKILQAAALLRVLPEVVDRHDQDKPPAYILQVPEYDDVYFSEDLKYIPEEVQQFAVAKVVDNKKLEQLKRNPNGLPYWGVARRGRGYRKKRSRKRTKRASKRRSKRVRRKTRRRKKSKRRR